MADYFCGKCGHSLQAGDLFCANCGALVGVSGPTSGHGAAVKNKPPFIQRILQWTLVASLFIALSCAMLANLTDNDVFTSLYQVAFLVFIAAILGLLIHRGMRIHRRRTIGILTGISALAFLAVVISLIADSSATDTALIGLQDESGSVRATAAAKLGELKHADTIDPLIEALGDPDPGVRQAAAYSLGAIGDARAVSALISRFDDPDEWVRLQAVLAAGKIADERAYDPLVTVLARENESEYVRQAAATSLAKYGDRSTGILIQAMTSGNPILLDVASDAISGIGAPAVDDLLQLLDSAPPGVRFKTAKALSRIDDPRADECLHAAISANDTVATAGAYVYFIRAGITGTEPALIQALSQYGTEEMAVTYLNCGNDALKNAAAAWAQAHGYEIYSRAGGSSALWGSK